MVVNAIQHDLSKEPCMIACILYHIQSTIQSQTRLADIITSTHTSGFLLVVSFFFITNEEKQQQQQQPTTTTTTTNTNNQQQQPTTTTTTTPTTPTTPKNRSQSFDLPPTSHPPSQPSWNGGGPVYVRWADPTNGCQFGNPFI